MHWSSSYSYCLLWRSRFSRNVPCSESHWRYQRDCCHFIKIVHANAVLSQEIYKIICIINKKKTVSMSAFYSQFFFWVGFFAKSALNLTCPLNCSPQGTQLEGFCLGYSMTSLEFSMIRSSQESSVIGSSLR